MLTSVFKAASRRWQDATGTLSSSAEELVALVKSELDLLNDRRIEASHSQRKVRIGPELAAVCSVNVVVNGPCDAQRKPVLGPKMPTFERRGLRAYSPRTCSM